ncbi:uncharacterized protein LOC141712945 [Apium graveolens]|uniref:uncharacterized protein LOC141712945 n=1 Tax=Apium graveolens TaxID=4045 RepID=UPI003D7BE088
MTRTKQTKRKGSQNFQSSSRAIEKRLIQRHMQRIPVALTYDHAPAYSNFRHGTIQGESVACADQFPGYIFMCNGKTKADCYKYRVFGLPSARMDILEKIKPHMRLFLYDFDMKLLYGVYVAASDGRLAIEPAAFGGQFSAQVRFEILRDCIPLPESIFKPAISDNYKGGSKFRQELSNKQVANLISLFRPVAELSPGIAGSLIPNTVRPATIIPRSSETRAQTASELSHEYNQYLARLNHADEGAASTIRHVEPGLSLAHAPHTLLANRDLPPDLGPYNSQDAYQAYFDGNPDLHHRPTGMPYDTERLMLQQVEPRNNFYKQVKTAAYWVQMASKDAKGVHSSSPASIGIGSESIGASDAVVGQACFAVQEINDRGTVQPKITVHDNNPNVNALTNDVATEPVTQSNFEARSHGPAHLHSSYSGAVYSGAQARQDPAPMYAGPERGLPLAGPGFVVNNMSLSLSETAPVAALQTGHAENFLQVSQARNYNPGMSVASANMPVQAHGQLLHQVPVQAHGQVLHQVPVQQAHGQVLHQVPAQSNSSAYPYYEDPGQVYQYYAQMPSSDNSAVYWTGVAHDPNQVYQYPHMPSSGNSSTYWAGMVYQDQSQAYQDSHMLTYGQAGSYSHNGAVNNPSLQVQVHNPSYVAAASHMPSST